jgi:hypothetical protein
MQNARLLIVFLALLCVSVCSFTIYTIEVERKEAKNDLVELSKIKYGLFNVDRWKEIFSEVLSKKIEDLDFSVEQQVDAREKITVFLYDAIDDMEEQFQYEQSKSMSGLVKIGVANLTGMFDEIKSNVPQYADEILTFLRAPENREKVKAYITEKLSEYTDKTFSKIDNTLREGILSKYGFSDYDQTIAHLQANVQTLDIKLKKYLYAALLVAFLCAFGLLFTPLISRWEFVMYTLISLGLLAAGLFLPMIEIDARIAQMNFALLGEQVSFSDQVLYYKSKSILEVVQVMLQQGMPDVLFVGVLVLLFSVLFPVSKLLTSMVFIFLPAAGNNRFVKFMLFRTGKWSMADVMVIAIFMSFIGFSGILTEQLGQLERLSDSLDVLTTNKSSLQDGFFLFTSFVVLSLLLTHRLEFKEKLQTTPEPIASVVPLSKEESVEEVPAHDDLSSRQEEE